uniref:Non-selective voltage-gated ion channel VDAC1 n=3 Tax=Seriola TaxID=8160 RepID=A0A3B4VD19_SERDU
MLLTSNRARTCWSCHCLCCFYFRILQASENCNSGKGYTGCKGSTLRFWQRSQNSTTLLCFCRILHTKLSKTAKDFTAQLCIHNQEAKIMAVPPTYVDLGKSARDVFTKGYGFGLIKLDLKTKSENGLEFTSTGSANTETSKVAGSLETKYKWSEHGLTFTEKWNTDNTLGTEITLEDQLAKGLKLTFDSSFSPNTGKKSGKIKTGYKCDHINLGCDVHYDINGTAIHGAAVVGYEGWLAGYQMTFEAGRNRITQSNFAVGYKTDEFQLHTNVNDGTEFGGSIYQKVNDQLETAVNLAWTAGNSNTRFGIAAKYQIDPDASFTAKVNNSSLVGLGYTQTLKPGIKLTLSALLDGKNINAGGHKLGLGLEFQA